MATTNKPARSKSKAAQARSTSSRSTASTHAASKTTTKTTKAKATPAHGRTTPSRAKPADPVVSTAVRHTFAGHGHDVAGIVLILVGIVMGLGLYADLAGPVGHGLAQAAGAVVGKAAYLVPPVLILLGALLIRGPASTRTAP